MRIDVFSEPADTMMAVSVEGLRALYVAGWSNGADDDCYECGDDSTVDAERLEGDDWHVERADSVERVALDMLEEISEWDARHPDEIPDAGDERRLYSARLSALGVVG